MARLARKQILFDGCFAHIISHSIEEREIFGDQRDFEVFLKLLAEVKREHPFSLYHYCLMHTHFHWVVSIPRLEAFEKAIQKLKWKYTTYYNLRHSRNGPLWRERFKSLVIEDERYLYACGLYVEYNPVRAGMVQEPQDWPYSSAAYYLRGKKDSFVDPYESQGLPEGIDLTLDAGFTTGLGIGSELFRLHLKEGAFA